jgi:hypothetical protein
VTRAASSTLLLPGVAEERRIDELADALDDEGQLRTGHGTRPALPVRADVAGADVRLEI